MYFKCFLFFYLGTLLWYIYVDLFGNPEIFIDDLGFKNQQKPHLWILKFFKSLKKLKKLKKFNNSNNSNNNSNNEAYQDVSSGN